MKHFQKEICKKLLNIYTLASSVHKFYNEHKVIGSSDEQNTYLKVLSMA
jgi:arginyl-tRNA synthetase